MAVFFCYIAAMYAIIADSGSTKTDWVLCREKQIVSRVKTAGINPYFHSRNEINIEILNNLKPAFSEYLPRVKAIHYYGTGCSSSANCLLVQECLSITLNVKEVNVAHDLLGAARALCGREWGIAAILGTGSNSCLYDGTAIIENIPSAGYLWSDYGGGSQIGKFFIRDYFEKRLPDALHEAFEAAGYNREVILENVYKGSSPNRYLAKVSLFVGAHLGHQFIQTLLEECFDSFFEQQIKKYSDSKKYAVNVVGSVGYFFREIISRRAEKHGYRTGRIIQSPMEGLLEFHSQDQ